METILTEIPGTVTAGRMGRPPLHVKETKVRLSDDARQRIEALVGPNRMAVFIREAIENELRRRERLASTSKPKRPPYQP
jgi:hypothetical protein